VLCLNTVAAVKRFRILHYMLQSYYWCGSFQRSISKGTTSTNLLEFVEICSSCSRAVACGTKETQPPHLSYLKLLIKMKKGGNLS